MVTLHHGDCLDVLKTLPDNSIDSIVTDPPYGLAFMGKRWDYDIPSVDIWRECLRVLKPGGHALIFGGTRTYHRMTCRVEDAGFEIRDMIAWVYGSGFPKSLDVSKAIDKAAGAEREVVGSKLGLPGYHLNPHDGGEALGHGLSSSTYETRLKSSQITAPTTEAAKQWQGWGTALKPALEPITMARKPLVGTVAANVLAHGTGALNIDGCRVGRDADDVSGWSASGSKASENRAMSGANYAREAKPDAAGRWPANLIHDGSGDVLAGFPSSGPSKARTGKRTGKRTGTYGEFAGQDDVVMGHDDEGGSAARFFYCAKASKADREEGLEGAPDRVLAMSNQAKAELARGNMHEGESGMNTAKVRKNHHPTVKPTDLMRYLCRLITPPNGVVLDPFMGSGSTGKAAVLEGFGFIGIEREAEYVRIASARIEHAHNQHIAKRPSLSEISDLGCRDDVYKTSLTINVL